MNKTKELFINTLIIFVGKFCTQFVSFLLIPIYTHYLIASDYGYVDLIQSYVSLFAPIIILRFDSAIFRFLIDCRDKEEDKEKIISSSFYLILFQIILFILLFLVISRIWSFKYPYLILLNIVSISISSYLLQLIRGIGKNIDYSIGSIITAILTIIINILLILRYHCNASSILYSSIIANIFCSIFLIIKNKLFKIIRFKKIDIIHIKQMLKYSLPMIPDGLSWWILNVSDRTIISLFINTAANGIYAISSKFSNILSSLFQVFNMSWQESASLHMNDKDRDYFFTDILDKSYTIFFSICLFVQATMPIIFHFFIGKGYSEAYNYIPILLLGNLFNAIANVLGGIYIAKKDTKSVAKTTVLSAIINLVINLLLIKKCGLYAAAISTLLSYLIVAFYRYHDIRKSVNITMNFKKIILTMIIYCASTILYYYNIFLINFINIIIIIFITILLNKSSVLIIYNKLRRKKKLKRK